MSSEGTATLVCIECGLDFDSSARYARHIRRGAYPQICKTCRRTAQASSRPTEADRRYWIEQFGREGAIQLANAIWGDELDTEDTELLIAAAR